MPHDKVSLSKTSMYCKTPVYNAGGEIVFGLRREVVAPDLTDRVIEITQATQNRLDLLSYELYGTTELWWVIAELNQIVDPMTEIAPGVQIRVPQKSRALALISSQ